MQKEIKPEEMDQELEFKLDDGTIEKGYIIGDAMISGIQYIMVTNTKSDDGDAWILKDISEKTDKEAIYEEVTDLKEWDAIAGVFQKILDEENIHIIL